jgi:divalent metal cation (Fe/Co/Zn/Cd) transporter
MATVAPLTGRVGAIVAAARTRLASTAVTGAGTCEDADPPDKLAVLAAAGAVGCAGNWIAARIRTRAGRRLDSPALAADGAHARADAYVSLAVVATAAAVAVGLEAADAMIALVITAVILNITRQSWRTVRGGH